MSNQQNNDLHDSEGASQDNISEQEATATNQEESTPQDLCAQLQAELAELQTKHAEVSEAYLRAKAETENTRRRAIEEEAKARKFAIESFAKDLLPVRDSLETALNEPNQTFETIKEGFEITLKQLTSVFERYKLVEISPAAGDKLDPHIHQAIAIVPSEEQEPNTIVNVLQKGYILAERTIRPATVTVAAKKE